MASYKELDRIPPWMVRRAIGRRKRSSVHHRRQHAEIPDNAMRRLVQFFLKTSALLYVFPFDFDIIERAIT